MRAEFLLRARGAFVQVTKSTRYLAGVGYRSIVQSVLFWTELCDELFYRFRLSEKLRVSESPENCYAIS